MTEIREVKLPGLGVRHEFTTQEGKRVGVVSHRSGRKELYFAHPDDPDAFKRMLGLSEEDARGEFSIAVAGLAVTAEVEPELEPLAVSYVFLLAVMGPIAARLSEPIADRLLGRPKGRTPETTVEAA